MVLPAGGYNHYLFHRVESLLCWLFVTAELSTFADGVKPNYFLAVHLSSRQLHTRFVRDGAAKCVPIFLPLKEVVLCFPKDRIGVQFPSI
jgi:hypothetical protein